MGTKRRVCVWYRRKRNEFVAIYPGQSKNTETVFPSQDALVQFARSAKLILKEREK